MPLHRLLHACLGEAACTTASRIVPEEQHEANNIARKVRAGWQAASEASLVSAITDVYVVTNPGSLDLVGTATCSPAIPRKHKPGAVQARILCMLASAAGASSMGQAGFFHLQFPQDMQWSFQRGKQAPQGWHAWPVCADGPALAAWGASDLTSLTRAMAAQLDHDDPFRSTLSAVACSVAIPAGASSQSVASSKECTPQPSSSLGWSSIQVTGTYVRDPEDGTLQPALLLSLELRPEAGPVQPPLPLTIVEPWGQRARLACRPIEPEISGTDRQAVRCQRKWLRAAAVLSASPYISTLLELDLAPRQPPALGNVTSKWLPPLEGSLQETPQGRVLLQNEGSLAYWGKLTSRHKTGSWQLLEELLQDTPGALDDLLHHLRDQRAALGLTDTGSAPRRPPSGAPLLGCLNVTAGAPWKKVVSVPSSNRNFAKHLSDQVAAMQRPLGKDSSQVVASWLGLPGGPLPALKPVQSRVPLSSPVGMEVGASGGGSPKTPSRRSPSQRTTVVNSRSQVPDEQTLSVTPSRQVMSMIAAVSGTVNKQTSINQRRQLRHVVSVGKASSQDLQSGSPLAPPRQSGSFVTVSANAALGKAALRVGLRPDSSDASLPHLAPASAGLYAEATPDLIGRGLYESDSDAEDSAQDLHAIDEEEGEEEEMRYHEVQVTPIIDPVTQKESVLLIQTDITSRTLMEQRIAALTEAQLRMLESMFPRHILEFVMGPSASVEDLGSLAYQHPQVTILFMDVVGFTSMSKEVAPHKVMEFLNRLFKKFDYLCDEYSVYKVETAGDCYIVAGSLMTYDEEGFVTLDTTPDGRQGAKRVLEFAQAMLRHARTVTMPHNGQPTSVRVGIHTGSVTSGLIGTKLPKFGLFGDTMNTSSRMESTGRPGCVQISEAMFEVLEEQDKAIFQPSGGVEVKGKGLMPTYIWTPSQDDLQLRPSDLAVEEAEEAQSETANSRPQAECRSSAPPGHLGTEGSIDTGDTEASTGPRGAASVLVQRAKSSVVRSAASGKRTQWGLVRSVVKFVAKSSPREPEFKAHAVRSRLSRIASGAKSSPVLGFDPSCLLPESARLTPGTAPHTPAPIHVHKQQSSMLLMKEMMKLMRATVDDSEPPAASQAGRTASVSGIVDDAKRGYRTR